LVPKKRAYNEYIPETGKCKRFSGAETFLTEKQLFRQPGSKYLIQKHSTMEATQTLNVIEKIAPRIFQ